MRPNISITLTTPHVTIERYSELTGLSIDTINDMLADGRLIRHRLSGPTALVIRRASFPAKPLRNDRQQKG
jgi:hypothetical protein|nr:MAG TPA: Regulatory protein [Caudoviricetes sp.]